MLPKSDTIGQKNCFFFDSGFSIEKDLLGGKGAGLVGMTRLGLPVPPGFIISTKIWERFKNKDSILSPAVWNEIRSSLRMLEQKTGRVLGDPQKPLFVSVRSGAARSMPGILETKINLGINRRTKPALEQIIGKEATKKIYKSLPKNFPEDPVKQIRWAIHEVYDSWNTRKARIYRQKHGIPEIGTAVTIQQMVWGNSTKDGAGTGVLFTRDTQKYSEKPVVVFAPHAQGSSVVGKDSSYVPVPLDTSPLSSRVRNELARYALLLENHYKGVPQDIEFTYDGDRLWILQTRNTPLSPLANLRSLRARIGKGLLTEQEAIAAIPPAHLHALVEHELDPQGMIEAENNGRLLAEGLSVSIGNKVGRLVFSLHEAKSLPDLAKIILVDGDLESFAQLPPNVKAVLLDKAGVGSHLAREGTKLSSERNVIVIFGVRIDSRYTGKTATVNGNSGKIYLGVIPYINQETSASLLSREERVTAQAWLSRKRENPWRFVTHTSDIEKYIKSIEKALKQIKEKNIRSLKAREITIFNSAFPKEIRQTYTVIKRDAEAKLVSKIRPILDDIFSHRHHATIRTCHDPALPANGPWALVRSQSDFKRFQVDDKYSEKYGGFRKFLSNSELSELLVGDIPIGKMEKDSAVQYLHSAWTLSCTENGIIILQVHPHNAHLREHEKAKKEDLITFTTQFDLYSPHFLEPIKTEIGDNLKNDKLGRKLAFTAKKHVLDTWWTEYAVPQRMAAITDVLGTDTTFEGQATEKWCLGYGIKTR